MKTLSAFGVLLIAAGCLPAQNRSGFINSGVIRRGAGNVLQPGGTSAMPGIQRFTPNVLFPAGGAQQIGIPGTPLKRMNVGKFPQQFGGKFDDGHFRRNRVFAFPIYVGGYGGYGDYAYPGFSDYGYPEVAPPPAMQQPNTTVIFPPQQPAPVIINQFGPGGEGQYAGPGTRIFEPAPNQAAAAVEQMPESEHYLIAFKDHTIYAALAYWVDGDTLHYFTAGNNHNQASVSLVDRELTARLNQGTGHEVKLPPAK